MNILLRIRALVIKELQVLFSDPESRKLIFMPVIMQMVLFPMAATLEVKNNTLAVFNEDNGAAAHELVQRFSQAAAFTELVHLGSEQATTEIVDRKGALAVVHFPPDFSSRIARGESAPLQILLDGRRSNSSQIAASYLQEIVSTWLGEKSGAPRGAAENGVIVRHRYNPNLEYTWFILPCLVAIILTIGSLVTTSLSVARERERGTFDQLLVSPLTPEMIMLGKAIPSLIVGMAQATAIVLGAVLFYRVPFEGSLLMLYAAAVLYFLALVGFGLLISSICSTQQQAFLGAFSFMMPATLLSGFASPVENMPQWLQTVTYINPIRHFIVIVQGIFLKDIPAGFALQNALPLLLTAIVTLALATLRFRTRLS